MSKQTEVEDRTAPLVPNVTTTATRSMVGGESRPRDDEIDRLQRALARGE